MRERASALPVLWSTLLALAWLSSCVPRPEGDVSSALASWFDAAASGDRPRMIAVLAGCREGGSGRPGGTRVSGDSGGSRDCAGRLSEIEASVSAQRELRRYRFDDPWGLGLVQALVLGRGGYWELLDVHLEESDGGKRHSTARLLVRTQYRAEETRGLPRGAEIEYLVAPLGTVQRLARGQRGPGALRQELVELVLEARLVSADEDVGPGHWLLEELRPLPETAVYRQVAWRPE